MTLASLIAYAAEGAGSGEGNVMLETIWYPIIAAVVFFFLAMVAFSYRNVANRHIDKADAYAQEHGTDVQPSGHGH